MKESDFMCYQVYDRFLLSLLFLCSCRSNTTHTLESLIK